MSTWTGHIGDEPTARQMNGSSYIAENNLSIAAGSLSTVAVAEAAADAAVLTQHICDRPIGDQCSRGFRVASDLSATFGSTWAAFHASLPDASGHPTRAING